MPIVEPRLDDLRYDRIVSELIRRIPVYAPEWTDHNDSDPGITFIQLFAYLTEQVGYRLNRIPEKNHIELLKLLGVRLKPPRAATTRLALLLDDPTTHKAVTIQAGARARAKKGNPPPVFETDFDVDTVPAQLSLLVTTKNPFLTDVRKNDDPSPPDPPPTEDKPTPEELREWLSVSWEGKNPDLKKMPQEPVAIASQAGHRYLWIGLQHNDDIDAGFRDVRVTLTVQFDDDEQPSLEGATHCQPHDPAGQTPLPVNCLHDHGIGFIIMTRVSRRRF